MTDPHETLEDLVLRAFTTAQEQQDPEVAEHMLRALEVLGERESSDPEDPPDPLRAAYAALARSATRDRH